MTPVTLFAGQSGEGHQPGSIEEMKEYAKDMKTWNNVGIPDWVSQAMDLLKEVEDTKVESQVRVRESRLFDVLLQAG